MSKVTAHPSNNDLVDRNESSKLKALECFSSDNKRFYVISYTSRIEWLIVILKTAVHQTVKAKFHVVAVF